MKQLAVDILVQLINGLTYGMILALIASGFTLILGVLRVLNFAHGELYMAGAYVAWAASLVLGNFWLSVAVAGVALALIGLALQKALLDPILDRGPLDALMITFGVSLVFQQGAMILFGPVTKNLRPPVQAGLPFFQHEYPAYRVVIMLIAAAILTVLWLALHRSRVGSWVRATVQDREMAAAMGVPVPKVHRGVFALGSAIAGVSGALVAPLFSVSHTMGLNIIISSFIVVLVGGMGSLPGSIVAGIMIGELESLGSLVVKPSQAQIFSLVALLVVLLLRPQGLFGVRGLMR